MKDAGSGRGFFEVCLTVQLFETLTLKWNIVLANKIILFCKRLVFLRAMFIKYERHVTVLGSVDWSPYDILWAF